MDQDPNLAQEWMALRDRRVAIPEFIEELLPGWEPGKFLSEEALFRLYTDSKLHDDFLEWVKEEFVEVDAFLEEKF